MKRLAAVAIVVAIGYGFWFATNSAGYRNGQAAGTYAEHIRAYDVASTMSWLTSNSTNIICSQYEQGGHGLTYVSTLWEACPYLGYEGGN